MQMETVLILNFQTGHLLPGPVMAAGHPRRGRRHETCSLIKCKVNKIFGGSVKKDGIDGDIFTITFNIDRASPVLMVLCFSFSQTIIYSVTGPG